PAAAAALGYAEQVGLAHPFIASWQLKCIVSLHLGQFQTSSPSPIVCIQLVQVRPATVLFAFMRSDTGAAVVTLGAVALGICTLAEHAGLAQPLMFSRHCACIDC